MKKGSLILAALTVLASNMSFAKVDICVFDLLGKSGESYKLLEEWQLVSKQWGTEVQLLAYQDEAKVDQDFKAGKCDGLFMTSMRARAYNKFAGSIDAIGGVPSNDIAMKAISYVLDQRNAKRLVSTLGKDKYEVAGIVQIGTAYILYGIVP